MALEQISAHLLGKKSWGDGVIRDLDVSLCDQGPVNSAYEFMFQKCSLSASLARFASVQRLYRVPRPPGILMLGYASGFFCLYMKMRHYGFQKDLAAVVFKHGDEHMKKELAKIILNNHSTDKSRVELLKRHYVADHLLSDEHQETPLFRWRQRQSYVDSAFMERLKEELIEIVKKRVKERMEENETNNEDEAESSVNSGLFEEDPLACILGTPDSNRKMNMSLPQHTRELLIEQVTSTLVCKTLKTTSVSDMLEIAAKL